MLKQFTFATCLGLAVLATGCKGEDEKPRTAGGGGGGASAPAADGHAGPSDKHHNRVPMGEPTVSGMRLVATVGEPVKPGGEGAFGLVITGGKPKAVRFWVGVENGEGSVKAKAEEESADNWHTHVE